VYRRSNPNTGWPPVQLFSSHATVMEVLVTLTTVGVLGLGGEPA